MLIVHADVVTFDDTRRVLENGRILVGDDGRITDVLSSTDPVPAAFADARVITYAGFVYPGLVDLHNHIPYNTIGLWTLPGHPEPFTDHNQWTKPAAYSRQITAPQKFLGWAAGAALLTYVEMKAVLGGTTTLQGNGKAHPVDGVLARNLDTERFGGPADKFRVDTLVLNTPEQFTDIRDAMTAGAGFIYHLAEGDTGPAMAGEWQRASDGGVIQPNLVAIHGTGLEAAQLQALAGAGSSLVWSPFSNMWLYGRTADIATAHQQGLRLCIGSDWAPSGTRNVLGELKVAKLWNTNPAAWYPTGTAPQIPAGGVFTDQDLCELATRNPGDAIAHVYGTPQVGRIQPGYLADLILVRHRHTDPCANLIHATEADVELVLIGGEARCGTPTLIKASGAANTTPMHFSSGGHTHQRRALLRDPRHPSSFLTWPAVTARLDAVRADPDHAGQELATALKAVLAGERDPVFVLEGDMPDGDTTEQSLIAGIAPAPVAIPPIDPLTHDNAYFDAVDANPYHRGLLSPLRNYYPDR